MIIASPNTQQTNLPIIENHKIKVIASFFPLYDFARHIGGNRVDVSAMVPIGTEPHDWEPTIQQVQEILTADVFVYNGAGIDKWADSVRCKTKGQHKSRIAFVDRFCWAV